ncbi:MAG: His/Gly/Thr/Pro-type tRNA ligase C-terminal domain-containing protein, partial [Candidatus Omnitrophota bacterium]
VILDDRDKSAGVKFKDSDLVGFPVQVIVGKRNLDQGKVEVKLRKTGEKNLVEKNDILNYIRKCLK